MRASASTGAPRHGDGRAWPVAPAKAMLFRVFCPVPSMFVADHPLERVSATVQSACACVSWLHARVRVHMHADVGDCMHALVCIHTCMHACMHACVCMCMYCPILRRDVSPSPCPVARPRCRRLRAGCGKPSPPRAETARRRTVRPQGTTRAHRAVRVFAGGHLDGQPASHRLPGLCDADGAACGRRVRRKTQRCSGGVPPDPGPRGAVDMAGRTGRVHGFVWRKKEKPVDFPGVAWFPS